MTDITATVKELHGWTPPPGWGAETYDALPKCIVIGSYEDGWVTVNMDQRTFELGVGLPKLPPRGYVNTFTGRGWQKRILAAATDRLMKHSYE